MFRGLCCFQTYLRVWKIELKFKSNKLSEESTKNKGNNKAKESIAGVRSKIDLNFFLKWVNAGLLFVRVWSFQSNNIYI